MSTGCPADPRQRLGASVVAGLKTCIFLSWKTMRVLPVEEQPGPGAPPLGFGSTYWVSWPLASGIDRPGPYTGLYPARDVAEPSHVASAGPAFSICGQLDSTLGFRNATALSMVKASLEWTGPSTWSPAFHLI